MTVLPSGIKTFLKYFEDFYLHLAENDHGKVKIIKTIWDVEIKQVPLPEVADSLDFLSFLVKDSNSRLAFFSLILRYPILKPLNIQVKVIEALASGNDIEEKKVEKKEENMEVMEDTITDKATGTEPLSFLNFADHFKISTTGKARQYFVMLCGFYQFKINTNIFWLGDYNKILEYLDLTLDIRNELIYILINHPIFRPPGLTCADCLRFASPLGNYKPPHISSWVDPGNRFNHLIDYFKIHLVQFRMSDIHEIWNELYEYKLAHFYDIHTLLYSINKEERIRRDFIIMILKYPKFRPPEITPFQLRLLLN